MIQTGFESRIKIQDIVSNQLPEFILDESPKLSDFLKQYYISQEYQGGPVDIAENLDQYLNLDNLTPEVVIDKTTTTSDISIDQTTISVSSTKGFPKKYGLLKIDDEIITYTGLTANTFTGCIRGFSGVTSYHQDLDNEDLVFSQSDACIDRTAGAAVWVRILHEGMQEVFTANQVLVQPTKYDYTFVSNSVTLDGELAETFYLDGQALTSNGVLNLSNFKEGKTYTIRFEQGSGQHNLVFPTGEWINDGGAYDFTTLANNQNAIITITKINGLFVFSAKELS